MDGVSGAASVITVVGVALNSTQAIYSFVSGIKNGPKTIQQIMSSIQDLSKLLNQLQGRTDQFDLAAQLDDTVKRCAQDLKAFEQGLAKLSPLVGNRGVRLWKKLKTSLREKELERTSRVIQSHTAALSLQLKRGGSQSIALERVEALSNTHVVLTTKNSSTLERTSEAINQMNTNVQAIGTTASTLQQNALQSLEQLSDKVQNLSGMSAEQTEKLNTISNAFLELRNMQSPPTSQQPAAESLQYEYTSPEAVQDSDEMEIETDAEPHDSPGDENGLQQVLDRLCHLAQEQEKTVFSKEAEKIIDDVHTIFDLLLLAEDEERGQKGKGKRVWESYEKSNAVDQLLHQPEVKRIKGLLSTSHNVSINDKVPRSSSMVRYRVRNTYHEQRSRNGIVTIQGRYKYRTLNDSPQECAHGTRNDFPDIFLASFAFQPRDSRHPRIAVNFQQMMAYTGSFLKTPALTVSALLPYNSKNFRLIEEGNLLGLKRFLSSKKGFLTDRDLQGRCLLNYALPSEQLDICRFLIDEGADGDFVEHSGTWELLLFEAGADPTLDKGDSRYSFVMDVLHVGNKVTLKMMLDHGSHFIGSDNGISPNLSLSYLLLGRHWALDTITLLLRRQGKGGLPTQNLDGCLHEAILGSCHAEPHDLTEALILLIKNGADVYAKDVGRTVSDIACCKWILWRERSVSINGRSEGRYNSDLPLRKIWTDALKACGYDPEEVISATLRVKELADDEDTDLFYQSEDPNQDRSEQDLDSPARQMSKCSDPDWRNQENITSGPTHSPFLNDSDRFLLEVDAQVWGDD